MELIATARFKKAMDRATAAAAYTKRITELVADLAASGSEVSHPLLEAATETKPAMLLVLTANRGLCGGYNSSVLRQAFARCERAAGARARRAPGSLRQARHLGLQFPRHHADRDVTRSSRTSRRFDEVEELANRYLEMYVSRQDRPAGRGLHAVRQRRAGRSPWSRRCCRLARRIGGRSATASRQPHGDQSQYEFLPSAESILEEIVPTSFKVKLFKCFLDAAVSEQIARMVAMKAATENADDMIKQLTHGVQPGPAEPDHQRDHGNHRRRRGAEIDDQAIDGKRLHRDVAPHDSAFNHARQSTHATPRQHSCQAPNIGHVTQVIGSTFDAEFAEGHLPDDLQRRQDRLATTRASRST